MGAKQHKLRKNIHSQGLFCLRKRASAFVLTIRAASVKDGLQIVYGEAVLILDMLCKLRKVLTVEMNELAAAETLEVKMAAALFLVLDILIAGAGLAVKGVLAHKPLFYKTVKLSVYSGNSHGSSLSR